MKGQAGTVADRRSNALVEQASCRLIMALVEQLLAMKLRMPGPLTPTMLLALMAALLSACAGTDLASPPGGPSQALLRGELVGPGEADGHLKTPPAFQTQDYPAPPSRPAAPAGPSALDRCLTKCDRIYDMEEAHCDVGRKSYVTCHTSARGIQGACTADCNRQYVRTYE